MNILPGKLIEAETNPDIFAKNYSTAVLIALENKNLEIAKMLIKAMFDRGINESGINF